MQQGIEDFLDYLAAEKGYSANTIGAYRNDLSQFREYLEGKGAEDWDQLGKDFLIPYILHLKERGYAASTVARKVASLKSLFHFLAAEARIRSDPTATLESPRTEKRLPKALSQEDVERLLAAPSQDKSPKGLRDRAILELLYATGMRVSELVSLNLEDVSLKWGNVRCLGKGSKERLIPIHDAAIYALEQYMKEGRPGLRPRSEEKALFVNQRGERLTRQGLWLIIKEYAQAVGIGSRVSPHVLRHSFATHILRGGLNLRQVQELLGHSSISTTQVYTQVTTQRLREAYDQAHPRA